MGEIGAGNGASYPNTLDTEATQESATTIARKEVPNDLAACVIAIETELGLLPKGSFATVRARLDATIKFTAGLASARPAVTAGLYELYFATDEVSLSFSSGTTWYTVMGIG